MGIFAVDVDVLAEYSDLVSESWLRIVAEKSLAAESQQSGTRVSVIITNDDVVRNLNKRHRGLDENTDVLAFSFKHEGHYYGEEEILVEPDLDFALPPGEEMSIGEIIISYPQACRQAQENGIRGELGMLVAHGVLHLLGYTHEDAAEEANMDAKTVHIITRAKEFSQE